MWGRCDSGQLGIGHEWLRDSDDEGMLGVSRPHRVEGFGGERVVQVACGAFHSAAVTESGSVYIWGKEDYGMLGVGQTSDVQTPRRIELFDKLPALYVCATETVLAGNSAVVADRTFCVFGCCCLGKARVVRRLAHSRCDQVWCVLLVWPWRVRTSWTWRHEKSLSPTAGAIISSVATTAAEPPQCRYKYMTGMYVVDTG